MLDNLDSTLDPECQLVELSWLTVFSHALEFTTNLCEMKIRRGGAALITFYHSLLCDLPCVAVEGELLSGIVRV